MFPTKRVFIASGVNPLPFNKKFPETEPMVPSCLKILPKRKPFVLMDAFYVVALGFISSLKLPFTATKPAELFIFKLV